jgi:hypothetical protein
MKPSLEPMARREPTNSDASELLDRLRALLLRVELECGCRASLAAALDRFAVLEKRRVQRGALARARDQKDRIVAILAFLSELDQINERESDRSVFEEMALVFLEIASCAEAGAEAVREVGRKTSSERS